MKNLYERKMKLVYAVQERYLCEKNIKTRVHYLNNNVFKVGGAWQSITNF